MQRWKIGEVTITKVVELEALGGMSFILPQAQPEAVRHLEWLKPHFMDEHGRLRASVHAFVVETPERRIVVDTCIGNYSPGPGWICTSAFPSRALARREECGVAAAYASDEQRGQRARRRRPPGATG